MEFLKTLRLERDGDRVRLKRSACAGNHALDRTWRIFNSRYVGDPFLTLPKLTADDARIASRI
jgi:hypothetical protein